MQLTKKKKKKKIATVGQVDNIFRAGFAFSMVRNDRPVADKVVDTA